MDGSQTVVIVRGERIVVFISHVVDSSDRNVSDTIQYFLNESAFFSGENQDKSQFPQIYQKEAKMSLTENSNEILPRNGCLASTPRGNLAGNGSTKNGIKKADFTQKER
jgi:hypothetical protein